MIVGRFTISKRFAEYSGAGETELLTAGFVAWTVRGIVVRANGHFVGFGFTRGAALGYVLEVGLYTDTLDGHPLLNGNLPPAAVLEGLRPGAPA